MENKIEFSLHRAGGGGRAGCPQRAAAACGQPALTNSRGFAITSWSEKLHAEAQGRFRNRSLEKQRMRRARDGRAQPWRGCRRRPRLRAVALTGFAVRMWILV